MVLSEEEENNRRRVEALQIYIQKWLDRQVGISCSADLLKRFEGDAFFNTDLKERFKVTQKIRAMAKSRCADLCNGATDIHARINALIYIFAEVNGGGEKVLNALRSQIAGPPQSENHNHNNSLDEPPPMKKRRSTQKEASSEKAPPPPPSRSCLDDVRRKAIANAKKTYPKLYGNIVANETVRSYFRHKEYETTPILLLDGPPGVGKSTAVLHHIGIAGFSPSIVNASDARNIQSVINTHFAAMLHGCSFDKMLAASDEKRTLTTTKKGANSPRNKDDVRQLFVHTTAPPVLVFEEFDGIWGGGGNTSSSFSFDAQEEQNSRDSHTSTPHCSSAGVAYLYKVLRSIPPKQRMPVVCVINELKPSIRCMAKNSLVKHVQYYRLNPNELVDYAWDVLRVDPVLKNAMRGIPKKRQSFAEIAAVCNGDMRQMRNYFQFYANSSSSSTPLPSQTNSNNYSSCSSAPGSVPVSTFFVDITPHIFNQTKFLFSFGAARRPNSTPHPSDIATSMRLLEDMYLCFSEEFMMCCMLHENYLQLAACGKLVKQTDSNFAWMMTNHDIGSVLMEFAQVASVSSTTIHHLLEAALARYFPSKRSPGVACHRALDYAFTSATAVADAVSAAKRFSQQRPNYYQDVINKKHKHSFHNDQQPTSSLAEDATCSRHHDIFVQQTQVTICEGRGTLRYQQPSTSSLHPPLADPYLTAYTHYNKLFNSIFRAGACQYFCSVNIPSSDKNSFRLIPLAKMRWWWATTSSDAINTTITHNVTSESSHHNQLLLQPQISLLTSPRLRPAYTSSPTTKLCTASWRCINPLHFTPITAEHVRWYTSDPVNRMRAVSSALLKIRTHLVGEKTPMTEKMSSGGIPITVPTPRALLNSLIILNLSSSLRKRESSLLSNSNYYCCYIDPFRVSEMACEHTEGYLTKLVIPVNEMMVNVNHHHILHSREALYDVLHIHMLQCRLYYHQQQPHAMSETWTEYNHPHTKKSANDGACGSSISSISRNDFFYSTADAAASSMLNETMFCMDPVSRIARALSDDDVLRHRLQDNTTAMSCAARTVMLTPFCGGGGISQRTKLTYARLPGKISESNSKQSCATRSRHAANGGPMCCSYTDTLLKKHLQLLAPKVKAGDKKAIAQSNKILRYQNEDPTSSFSALVKTKSSRMKNSAPSSSLSTEFSKKRKRVNDHHKEKKEANVPIDSMCAE